MRCQKARRYIYLSADRELTPEEASGLQEHLKTCPRCGALHQQVERLCQLLQADREQPVPEYLLEDLWAGVNSRLQSLASPNGRIAWRPKVSFPPPRAWRLRWAWAFALLLVLGLLWIGRLLWFSSPPPEAPPSIQTPAVIVLSAWKEGQEANILTFQFHQDNLTILWVE